MNCSFNFSNILFWSCRRVTWDILSVNVYNLYSPPSLFSLFFKENSTDLVIWMFLICREFPLTDLYKQMRDELPQRLFQSRWFCNSFVCPCLQGHCHQFFAFGINLKIILWKFVSLFPIILLTFIVGVCEFVPNHLKWVFGSYIPIILLI